MNQKDKEISTVSKIIQEIHVTQILLISHINAHITYQLTCLLSYNQVVYGLDWQLDVFNLRVYYVELLEK
jgi:hypothetical protein